MRLVLIGPPGSGKGTQAKLLTERLDLAYIGTGDILRSAIQQGTDTGKAAEPFLKAGKLVPDDLVNQVVAELFRRPDRPRRYVLDGYPRTVNQARWFDGFLRELGEALNAAVNLEISDEEVVHRLSGRQREDDKEETVRHRLAVFHSAADDLIDYYRHQGKLREVSALGPPETIYNNIIKVLQADSAG
jgi:adenylate kinase